MPNKKTLFQHIPRGRMIYLVNMPFGINDMPSLGLGIIQALLKDGGLKCSTLYLNQDFLELTGLPIYSNLCRSNIYAGEWLFSESAWKNVPSFKPVPLMDYMGSFKLPELKIMPDQEIKRMENLSNHIKKNIIPLFLNNCLNKILGLIKDSKSDVPVFGFSLMSSQTNASLALAGLLKESIPNCRIIFGGPNIWDTAGIEILKKCSFIDAVCLHESDAIALDLFKAFSKKTPDYSMLKKINNIAFKTENKIVKVSDKTEPASGSVLSSSPTPDFTDFFYQIPLEQCNSIPFETSRGCWWGEKHQCKFCGLNGKFNCYRLKSPESIKKTLQDCLDKYPCYNFYGMDNNLSFNYISNLLPQLGTYQKKNSFFFSLKANLEKKHFLNFKKGNVTAISPGIESLSNHILGCMNKGVTALQNIYTLKLCLEFGIQARWNILSGIPGEKKENYDSMTKLIPFISHLQPPFGIAAVQLYRDSVYFNDFLVNADKSEFLSNMRPASFYKKIFPAQTLDLEKVAYAHECSWKNCIEQTKLLDFKKEIELWKKSWSESDIEKPELSIIEKNRLGIKILDTRVLINKQANKKIHCLNLFQTSIIFLCKKPIKFSLLKKAIKTKYHSEYNKNDFENNFKESLETLIKKGFILFEPAKSKKINSFYFIDQSNFHKETRYLSIIKM